MDYITNLSKRLKPHDTLSPLTYERPEIKEFVEYRESGHLTMWGPPWVKWFPWSR